MHFPADINKMAFMKTRFPQLQSAAEPTRILAQITRERAELAGKGLARSIKNKIRFILKLRAFIIDDLKKSTKLNWRHTLRAWRYGFLRFRYKLYGLDQGGDPAQFISDFACYMTHDQINGRFNEWVANKYAFGLLMNFLGMPTPAVRGLIKKGAFHPFGASRTMKASEFLLAAIAPGEKIVLKPTWGWHGFGFICLARDDQGYRLNGEIVPQPLAAKMIDGLDDYIVTDFVIQGQFSRTLYAQTPNTVRVVTLWDAEKSEAFVARAVLRIGTSRSFPVDNFKAGQGGLSAMIDPVTGELGPGAMAENDGTPVWHRNHPESHAPIQGVVVPAWNEVRTKILDYAGQFPFIPFIGWDIILTDGGFSILEVNATSGMPVLQVHGPFLADARVKRFFQYS